MTPLALTNRKTYCSQFFNIILLLHSPAPEIHTWQIFLGVCCIPSLLSGISVMFLPESPKFLMAQGRNGEAMAVFRRLYALNTGRSPHQYPVSFTIVQCMHAFWNATWSQHTHEGGDGNFRFRTVLCFSGHAD